jgi:hypothetical protein
MECHRCPFFPFVKGISKYKIPDSFDKFKDKTYKAYGEELRSVLSKACCYCSQHSSDDNPSNHGQTFVSLDDAENVGGEYNDAKQDFIISNAKEGYSRASLAGDPFENVAEKSELAYLKEHDKPEYRRRLAASREVSYTNLPAAVEQVLKKELMDFASLEIQDMMLLCCCMKGITISEFATMRWFPRGMLFKNSSTLKPVTKQASHARFMNVIKKFPTFKTVARYLRPDNVNKGGGYRGKKREEDGACEARGDAPSPQGGANTRNQAQSPRTERKLNNGKTASKQVASPTRDAKTHAKRQTLKKHRPDECIVQGDLFLA